MADAEGPRKLMKLAAALSSAYYTPIPFWLSLPPREMYSWVETANEMAKERNRQRKR